MKYSAKNLIALAACAVCAYAFSAMPAARAHTEATIFIQMTESGFSPEFLEIIQGDTVIFQNKGTANHWPASNIHPSHQIYPEFDPKRGIPPGEEWSFEFEKAGEWRLHDHIFPEFSGVITVSKDDDFVPRESPPAEKKSIIENLKNKIKTLFAKISTRITRFYFKLFTAKLNEKLKNTNMLELAKNETGLRKWIDLFGPEKAMADLLEDSGNGSILDCHQEAHKIGRISYEIFGPDVFGKGSAYCHSGYYHGAMEAFLKEKGTDNIAANISAVCDAFDTRFSNFECLHGVGHGVLAYEDYDMPRALLMCGRLRDDFAQKSCYGGLFMENIVTAQGIGAVDGHKTSWANNDPHFPCNKVDENYDIQVQCYQMQTSWMLTLFKNDFDQVAKECMNSPQNMIAICFASMGRDAAGNSLRIPEKIIALCGKVPNASGYYDECVKGALNVIVDFWGGNLKDQASALCKLIPEINKQSCYSILAMRLNDIFNTKEERGKVCQNFEPNYRYSCS